MPHSITLLKSAFPGKISDAERLRPEELNQQNIEALVAESNLVRHKFPFILILNEQVLLAYSFSFENLVDVEFTHERCCC